MSNWTSFRLLWQSGPPPDIRSAFELGRKALQWCAELKDRFGSTRWHYKWTPNREGADFLRVEWAFSSAIAARLKEDLRKKALPMAEVKPQACFEDGVYDKWWTKEETDSFGTVWWKWSELLLALVTTSKNITYNQIQLLHTDAFQLFTTGRQSDLLHNLRTLGLRQADHCIEALIEAMTSDSFPILYRVPPRSRQEKVDKARIHYLMNSIWFSDAYPW